MAKVTILKSGGSLSPDKAREMLHDGTAHGKKLTPKQRRYFGYVSNQKADDGASLTPIGEGTSLFSGPSHEKGGIPFQYAGRKVEVEGGETLQEGPHGADVMGGMKVPGVGKSFANVSKIFAKKEQKTRGRMQTGADLVLAANPEDKWEILKYNSGEALLRGGIRKLTEIEQNKEHLSNIQRSMLEKADELGVDPHEFSKGKYVAASPEYIGKAKYGKHLPKAQMGVGLKAAYLRGKGGYKPQSAEELIDMYNSTQPATTMPASGASLAQRNNNPGNIMFGPFSQKFGAIQGEARPDGKGYFAKFPDVNTGLKAMRSLLTGPSYNNLTVEQASARWTGEGSYKNIPTSIKGKKIKDLSAQELSTALDTFTLGEDSQKYNWSGITNAPTRTQGPQTPFDAGVVELSPQEKKQANGPTEGPKVTPGNYNFQFTNPLPNTAPSNAEPLELTQILPELYTAATNKQEAVWLQQYQPELFEPYQVSFQDKLNEQQAQFRNIERMVSNNPSALATLAGQEYQASSSVLGDEFRTNQAIANDVTNKNISLLNEAKLKNLGLADEQYVRQSTAKSNTKAQNFNVLSSISDKLLQREADNRALKVYENLYPDYRFQKGTERIQYEGPTAAEWIDFPPITGNNSAVQSPILGRYSSLRQKYSPTGLKETTISTPSQDDIFKKELNKIRIPRYKQKFGGTLVKNFNTYRRNGSKTMGITNLEG